MQHFIILSAMPFLLKMMSNIPKPNHSSIRSPANYSCKEMACQESRASVKAPSSSDVLPDSTSKAAPEGIAHGALLEEQEVKTLLYVCPMKMMYNYSFS